MNLFVGLAKEVCGIIIKVMKKNVGCDFLSNAIRSVKTNTLNLSTDYPTFKESIDRVNAILNNNL